MMWRKKQNKYIVPNFVFSIHIQYNYDVEKNTRETKNVINNNI